MDKELIKELIREVKNSNIRLLSLKAEGFEITIETYKVEEPQAFSMPAKPETHKQLEVMVPSVPTEEKNLHVIRSPLVGTFYRSPSPGAPPFVEVGDIVSPGQVLCIIEALKVMNEIESDVAGRVVKILVENGETVEYGQPLFLIDTNV
ncbi:acetyl-CoA carboxylase biotin carboxyl carrier protein [Thermocrinis minervae]|uniref:Biotin carboxyl carrier protein of acetyl-CoA carboxylase n=1 Tax=Thermocrinis minervae TaxID=381751 RepID=A0A1M6QHU0_9AQUI|nr:acetyl-CoA carboxylase biotin carboxyl carrier protein [Thermocrinis minervae]SHK19623.1 acetyl-CoA carboxylase biotin carboxyl carrier protein [Thermocrinis minervae]